MGWIGKLIGGGIGLVLGGPIGALIGASAGHIYDSSPKNTTATEKSQTAYFVAIFACLAKMAKADGYVSKEEISEIEAFIKNAKMSPNLKKEAIEIFQRAKDDPTDVAEYLNQFGQIVSWDRQICENFVRTLHTLALADRKITAGERDILFQAERILRLRHNFINDLLGAANLRISEAYEILNCNDKMTDAEIKKAYRKKCLDFHPDKIQSKELPSEFVSFANEQMAKIHDAYSQIREVRGFR
ncbi:MAG: TerB family tellurite resistance protein [Candidatus Cloacimonadota bacterium]|nr:TerB family tellurite resistance protein [Candidatus Cloacimonadota bacterium]